MSTHPLPGLRDVAAEVARTGATEIVESSLLAAHRTAELGAFISLTDGAPPTVPGVLSGVPVAVKDNLDTEQFPTTGGTPALASSRPGRDHHAVARLRAAGAAVIGKTNLHELALGITSNNAAFGPVRNPHDRTRSAGGSSGGSAVAVATGVVPIALGTDTGGSVRIPAAHCGIVGWRPTVGRWGGDRCVPISTTRDTAGVLALTVADAALVDEVVTGESAGEVSSRAPRIGVPRAGFYDDLHPEVASTVEGVLDRLADSGFELVEVDVVDAHGLDEACGLTIALYEMTRSLAAYLATLPGPESGLSVEDVCAGVASPDVRAALEAALGGGFTDEVHHEALETREQLRAAYASALHRRAGSVDALIHPTVPLPAPPLGEDETTELNGRRVPVFATSIRNTGPGSTAGMPAISLPGGVTSGGLPIGISLEGFAGSDTALLATARRVEAVVLDR